LRQFLVCCTFVLMQKYQKIKTSTPNPLGSGPPLRKGRKLATLKQSALSDRKEGPLPPCGTVIWRKDRRGRKQSLSPFFSALLEKAGPQDGKLPAYVKKSICLSAVSLMDFSKSAVFQGFWKTGLALLVLLGQCQKDEPGFYPTRRKGCLK